MSRTDWEWKLKAINAFCQGLFLLNSCLALLVGFGLTIPSYCQGDVDCSYTCKILAWYLFINMVSNYLCIVCKASLSAVTKNVSASSSDKTSSLLLSPPVNPPTSAPVQLVYSNGVSNNQCHHGINSSYFKESPTDTTTTARSPSLHSAEPSLAGWTQCRQCDHLSPPRAKHCPLCNYCVLKRDHHCFFAGCCIGFHNQRYFVIFCLQTGIGCIYSTFFLYKYLNTHYEAANSIGYFAYFPPILPFLWLFGYTTWAFVGLILYFFFNVLTSSAGLYYFAVQLFLIFRGQTKYECEKSIKTYKGTVQANVKSVFGDFFPLNFFIPLPINSYIGNGIDWDILLDGGKLL